MWLGLIRSPASTWRIRTPTILGVAKVERDQVEDYARRKGMQISPRSSAGWGRS